MTDYLESIERQLTEAGVSLAGVDEIGRAVSVLFEELAARRGPFPSHTFEEMVRSRIADEIVALSIIEHPLALERAHLALVANMASTSENRIENEFVSDYLVRVAKRTLDRIDTIEPTLQPLIAQAVMQVLDRMLETSTETLKMRILLIEQRYQLTFLSDEVSSLHGELETLRRSMPTAAKAAAEETARQELEELAMLSASDSATEFLDVQHYFTEQITDLRTALTKGAPSGFDLEQSSELLRTTLSRAMEETELLPTPLRAYALRLLCGRVADLDRLLQRNTFSGQILRAVGGALQAISAISAGSPDVALAALSTLTRGVDALPESVARDRCLSDIERATVAAQRSHLARQVAEGRRLNRG